MKERVKTIDYNNNLKAHEKNARWEGEDSGDQVSTPKLVSPGYRDVILNWTAIFVLFLIWKFSFMQTELQLLSKMFIWTLPPLPDISFTLPLPVSQRTSKQVKHVWIIFPHFFIQVFLVRQYSKWSHLALWGGFPSNLFTFQI